MVRRPLGCSWLLVLVCGLPASAQQQHALPALPPGWPAGPTLPGSNVPEDETIFAPATFRGLGWFTVLPGQEFGSVALAVSADGRVVVGESPTPSGVRAFRWTAEDGLRSLGDLPGGGSFSTARAVNRDGTVIVGWSQSAASGQLSDAFIWTEATGMRSLGVVPGMGAYPNQALGVSDDGSVVTGVASVGFALEAFRWTPTTGMRSLGLLPGGLPPTLGTAVTPDGTVIVGSGFAGLGFAGFRWTQATGMVNIGDPPGGSQFAIVNAVSSDGRVLVGGGTTEGSGTATIAARWAVGEGWTTLGTLTGDDQTVAMGVSADGWMVVGSSQAASDRAFVWDPSRRTRAVKDWLRRLNLVQDTGLAAWQLESATAITPDGKTIIGYGRNPEGVREGWIATVPTYCYANCDGTTTAPALGMSDFLCFLDRFRRNDPAANCDGSTATPTLTSNDFVCFLEKYRAGCR